MIARRMEQNSLQSRGYGVSFSKQEKGEKASRTGEGPPMLVTPWQTAGIL